MEKAFYVKLKHSEVCRKLGRMIHMEDKFFFFPCIVVKHMEHLGKVQVTIFDVDGNKEGKIIDSNNLYEL